MEKARALYDKGLADMLAGNYATGCPALAESYLLSKRSGPLFTTAECEAKAGKLAAALRRYRAWIELYAQMDADDRATEAERYAIASDQVDALSAVVPTLTLEAPERGLDGAKIQHNGEPVSTELLGQPLPVEPGEHHIEVALPSGETRHFNVTLSKGEQRVVGLERPEPKAKNGAMLQTAGLIACAGGFANLVIGIGTGAATLAASDDIEQQCPNLVCSAEGKEIADDAQQLGNVSTAAFLLGTAGIAAGALLLLLPADDEEPAAAGGWQLLPVAVPGADVHLTVRRAW